MFGQAKGAERRAALSVCAWAPMASLLPLIRARVVIGDMPRKADGTTRKTGPFDVTRTIDALHAWLVANAGVASGSDPFAAAVAMLHKHRGKQSKVNAAADALARLCVHSTDSQSSASYRAFVEAIAKNRRQLRKTGQAFDVAAGLFVAESQKLIGQVVAGYGGSRNDLKRAGVVFPAEGLVRNAGAAVDGYSRLETHLGLMEDTLLRLQSSPELAQAPTATTGKKPRRLLVAELVGCLAAGGFTLDDMVTLVHDGGGGSANAKRERFRKLAPHAGK